MEKFYDIDKIKVVFYRQPFLFTSVDGYYDSVGYIRQFVYVNDGYIEDIFKEKYIAGLYADGQIPEFYYNPINYLDLKYFNESELKSGKVSERRLLEIYCQCNSKFITYDDALRQDKFRDNASVVDISRFNLLKKTLGFRNSRKKVEE